MRAKVNKPAAMTKNHPAEISRQNIRIQAWIASISVVLLLAKFWAYWLTDSVAILTDALESIVNVVASFIGLYSLVLSAKPRDLNHPYGHGKIELVSASLEGILIGVAGILIIMESVKRLMQPAPLEQLDAGIVLVAVAAGINYGLGYWAVFTGRKNHSPALVASGKHLQSDTWSSVGVLGGLAMLVLTGWNWVDPVLAIGFGLFILYTCYRILRTTVAGIMDEADIPLVQEVVASLEANRRVNWIDLHNLRLIRYGAILHIDCHVTIPWYFNVREAHDELQAVEDLIGERFGPAVESFIHADACLPESCPICTKMDCPVRQKPFMKKIVWDLDNLTRNQKHLGEGQ